MTQAPLKTDHDLRTAIVDELAWTPSVNADRIGVSPDAGAVTLYGRVETYPEKNMAVRAVMGVVGLTTIADIAREATGSSWAEYRQASNAVWATPEVTHVDNRLAVAP